MEQIKKATEAVAVPSRAHELKAEMKAEELEDLYEAYDQAHNKGARHENMPILWPR